MSDNNDSSLGPFELGILICGVATALLSILTPFLTQLNHLYDKVLFTFTSYYTIIIMIIIFFALLTIFIYRKLLLRSFKNKVEMEVQNELSSQQWNKEQKKRERQNKIDEARLKRNYKKANKLQKEQWKEEGLVKDEEDAEEDFEEKQDEEDEEETEDDKMERDYQNRIKNRISINVDFHKIFYKRKELNENEVKYLLKSGYFAYSNKSIVTGKKENYILKPRFNESIRHMFYIYEIKEYLEKRNIDVEIYTTRMPDVVFIINSKKFAIEVETGSVMKNKKKFTQKLSLLNKKFPKRWFFIVTNRNLLKKYKEFGEAIDPRFIKFNLVKIIKNA